MAFTTNTPVATNQIANDLVAINANWELTAPGVAAAAGDIIIATAANVVGVLSIGAAGGMLMVNSGASAPEWLAVGTGLQILRTNAGATAAEWTGPSAITAGTAVASTSGTSIDFTAIPSWVKRITIIFAGVSTNGTSMPLIQLGDAGGVETDGYVGGSCTIEGTDTTTIADSTAGLLIKFAAAASVMSGSAVFTLINGNNWVGTSIIGVAGGYTRFSQTNKTLTATLDRVRITTVNGTDEFDLGLINILYE